MSTSSAEKGPAGIAESEGGFGGSVVAGAESVGGGAELVDGGDESDGGVGELVVEMFASWGGEDWRAPGDVRFVVGS